MNNPYKNLPDVKDHLEKKYPNANKEYSIGIAVVENTTGMTSQQKTKTFLID